MPVIHVLPKHLVNKIAAGEVIERPASVVKELVENALDAGATRVEIRLADGGRKLIEIIDDGCGMDADDLSLAFAPHCTSKISTDDDLFAVSTMGFRGEALASIASIARVHARTRRHDAESGYEIDASDQHVGEVRPCPAAGGTTVSVRDLFFNTPARRKFMRTANTELGHVTEQLARLALPRPDVAFRLVHNDRELRNLPATETTGRRVADLFGSELADALLPLAPRRGDVVVQGLVARPSAARASGKWQYFFLNGRYVRDRVLLHALREAYRGLLEPSMSPVAFVFLEMDPEEVDVNVHPTKIEVRFKDSQLVHGELLAALKETLNKADLAPEASLPETEDFGESRASDGDEDRRESLRQALADFFKSAPPRQPRLSFPDSARRSDADRSEYAGQVGSLPGMSESPSPDVPPPTAASEAPEVAPAGEPPVRQEDEGSYQPVPHRPAVQIHNSYIVTQADEGLIIVDQHALHERLLYNDLHRRFAGGGLTAQRRLIPETLEVTAAEADLLDAHSDLLQRLGISVEPFGPQTVAVQAFPTLLTERGVSPGRFLRELLDALGDDDSADSERLLEELLSMMACKAAVKAGQPLTPGEIDDLLDRRERTDKHSACPHGRPTTIRLSLRELEKQFHRT
ncbi:MAG: DNA mismatch repair endonuclease MutL [Planctomycetota bacterium]